MNNASLLHTIIGLVLLAVSLCGCSTSGMKYEYDRRWDQNAEHKLNYHLDDWWRGERFVEMRSHETTQAAQDACEDWWKGKLALISTSSASIVTILGMLGVHLNKRQKEQLLSHLDNKFEKQNGGV